MTHTEFTQSLAVVGGTGALGSGLVKRAARAGLTVYIGSRDPDKAKAMADKVCAEIPEARVYGTDNRSAADQGDIVALTVPFATQLDTLSEIKSALPGKILIDTTVPLVPPKVARVQLPSEGSAAQRAQNFLGDQIDVVSGLHNVAAVKLGHEGDPGCDILIFGDRKESRDTVVTMLTAMSLRAWHGGSLANSAAAEAMTSVLIFINKMYGPGHAGIKITFAHDKE